jgi:hypothetical protein
VEQATLSRAVAVAADAREYVRYRADYATAAALDREAARLSAADAPRAAAVSRAEAAALREGATRRAVAAGVFGRSTLGSDLLHPTSKPRAFDYREHARALAEEESTGLDSPAHFNPEKWASAANDIRSRVRSLARWAFLMLVAVLLYTIAEVTTPRRIVYVLIAGGLAVYVTGVVIGLSTAFFA